MTRKEKRTNSILNSYKSIDIFKENINFTFDGGKKDFKTVVGATMTLGMLIIILAFIVHNSIEMVGRTNPNINTYVQYDYYNDNFTFNTSDPKYNFAFAFGIAEF